MEFSLMRMDLASIQFTILQFAQVFTLAHNGNLNLSITEKYVLAKN